MNTIMQSVDSLDTPIYRDDVLTLLALTVLADKRVLSEEISIFAKEVRSIEDELGLLTTFTEARLLVWFEQNRQRLKDMIEHETIESEMTDLFKRLKPIPNKDPLFSRMFMIANADGELHISERALIALAKTHWGMK